MNREDLLSQLQPIRHVELSTGLLTAAQAGLLVLGVVIFLLIIITLRKPWQRFRSRVNRLHELDQVYRQWQVDHNAHQFARSVSHILRQHALLKFSAKQVAGLTGERWLTFLDQNGGEGFFRSNAGQVMATAPYDPKAIIDPEAIIVAVGNWIRRNR